MPARTWPVEICGLVTRLRSDGARVAVPLGTYRMRERGPGQYELSGDDKPTFTKTGDEIAHHKDRDLTIEGDWP